jgi:hypothetical protein
VNEKKEKKMSIDIYMNGIVSFSIIITVLSMNETLSLSSSSIQLMIMSNKRMTCLISTRSRLQNHFTVVTLIQMFFVSLNAGFICGFGILYIASSRFRYMCDIIQSNIRLGSCSPFIRYTYLAIVLIKEVLLVSVYILSCCIYHWLGLSNSGTQVTWIKIRSWCVEATCIPFLCLAFLFEYSVGQINFVFDEHQTYYFLMIFMKLPLFFIMRFAESQSSFFLNHLELFLLQKTCEFLFE